MHAHPISIALAVGLALGLAIAPAQAADTEEFKLTRVEPLDGRTFETKSGKLFQLSGIHVPAPDQTCTDENREPYDCGARAIGMLDRVTDGLMTCVALPASAQEATEVRCYDFANRDIAALLVRAGWAVPDRNSAAGLNYTFDAMEAEARDKGMWQGRFSLSAQ